MMQGGGGTSGGADGFATGMSKILHLITDLKMVPGADIPFLVNLETQIIGKLTGAAPDPNAGAGAGGDAMGGGAPPQSPPGQPFGSGLPVPGGVPGMPPQIAGGGRGMPPASPGPGNLDELRRVLSGVQGQ